VAHVYTPLIAEVDFVRAAVTQQLDGLLAHYLDQGSGFRVRESVSPCHLVILGSAYFFRENIR
jgi:hypothetical protein